MINQSANPKPDDLQLVVAYGDTKRITTVFHWFIGTILAGLLAGIFILLLSDRSSATLLIVIAILPILASLYFVNHQKFEIAAFFLATILIVLITAIATIGLGIHHISIAGYPAVLIVASLVVRKRTMIFLTLFNILCVAWLVFGELYGAYTPTVLVHSVPGDFYSTSIILILTAIMVRLISESLFQSNLRLQKELKERKLAEEKYRHIFDNALDGIFQSAPDGRFINVNPAMARMYGYETPEQMINEISDISNQVYFDISQRDILQEKLRENGTVQGFEMQDRRKDGTVFWSSMNVRVVHDKEGNILYYEGTQEDITDRKLAEENLRQREAILNAVAIFAELLFKAADWRTEINGLLEMLGKAINASHAYLFEHFAGPDGVLLGTMCAEWTVAQLPSDLDNPFYQNLPVLEPGLERWYELLEHGQPFLGDRLNATPSEIDIFEARDMKAVLDVPIFVNGEWWGVIGFDDVMKDRLWTNAEVDALKVASNVLGAAIERQLVDTTLKDELGYRKRLTEELRIKNEELERFTYTVSHDLKAPLVTINGFLGYLEEDSLADNKDRLKNDIQRIQDATRKMQLLLNELLELSRVGRLVNSPANVPFDEIAREALDNVHGRLETSGVTVELSPNLPVIYGDRQRLVEVLQNLIDNAAKFMGNQPNPHIEIGQRGEENDKLVFFVRDNGIGIAPEYHERVFGLFDKLDPKTEGTGVGLSLVKRIIEFHGGRIWVESEAGSGATFYFTLPIHK